MSKRTLSFTEIGRKSMKVREQGLDLLWLLCKPLPRKAFWAWIVAAISLSEVWTFKKWSSLYGPNGWAWKMEGRDKIMEVRGSKSYRAHVPGFAEKNAAYLAIYYKMDSTINCLDFLIRLCRKCRYTPRYKLVWAHKADTKDMPCMTFMLKSWLCISIEAWSENCMSQGSALPSWQILCLDFTSLTQNVGPQRTCSASSAVAVDFTRPCLKGTVLNIVCSEIPVLSVWGFLGLDRNSLLWEISVEQDVDQIPNHYFCSFA